MTPDAKELWVASLRDGSFVKGKYGLRDLEDRYDATGVLCELAVMNGIIKPAKRYDKPDASVFFGYTYDGLATGISKKVEEWSGLSYRLGFNIAMKGDRGMSFDKIADWIEDNL